MSRLVKRVWKAIGALLGAAAGTQVDWVTNNVFQFDLPAQQDTAIAVLLAALGAYVAPKNKHQLASASELEQ